MSLVRTLALGERAVAGRGCARESRKPLPESDLLSPYPHIVENLSSEGRTYYNVIVFSCFFLPRMLRLIGNDRFFFAPLVH